MFHLQMCNVCGHEHECLPYEEETYDGHPFQWVKPPWADGAKEWEWPLYDMPFLAYVPTKHGADYFLCILDESGQPYCHGCDYPVGWRLEDVEWISRIPLVPKEVQE